MARLIVLLAVFSTTLTFAQGLTDQEIYERINEQMQISFRETIGEYDARLGTTPGNVRLAAERCATISAYAYSDYFTIDEAFTQSEICLNDLQRKFPGHPEVEIPLLNNRYDGDKIRDAEELLVYATDWYSVPQRARLLELLSQAHRFYGGDIEKADRYCAMALALDTAVACRLAAADHYVRVNSVDNAVHILTSPLDTDQSASHTAQKVSKLIEIGEMQRAVELFGQIDMETVDDYVRVSLAQDMATADLNDEAQQLLAGVSDNYLAPVELLRARYRVAIAARQYDEAQTHYDSMREQDFWADPLLRTRFELFSYAPALGWSNRDLVGLGALFLTFAFFILIASIPTILVHYRGLVRRAHGLLPSIREHSWSLRDSLYVSIVLVVGSLLALYIFEYEYLSLLLIDSYVDENALSGVDMPGLMIAQTLIYCLLLLPLFIVKRRLRFLGSKNWSVLRCIGVGVAFSVCFRILAVIPGLLSRRYPEIGEVLTTQETIVAMYQSLGIWLTLAIVAVVVPLLEEVSFRGALLHGFARHISLRWANLVQAGLFAALHESIIAFPFFVIFAYVASNLVIRAGGLLPAIVFHASFNGSAVLLLPLVGSAS